MWVGKELQQPRFERALVVGLVVEDRRDDAHAGLLLELGRLGHDGVVCCQADPVVRKVPDRGRDGGDSVAVLFQVCAVVIHSARAMVLRTCGERALALGQEGGAAPGEQRWEAELHLLGTGHWATAGAALCDESRRRNCWWATVLGTGEAHSVSFVLTPHQIITVFCPGSHVLLAAAVVASASSDSPCRSAIAASAAEVAVSVASLSQVSCSKTPGGCLLPAAPRCWGAKS